MFGWLRERRRKRLREAAFPVAWNNILARNMPLYRALPAADQLALKGHIQVFLAEKRFEGCGGLELTDEIRVTIAAQACVLLLRRQHDYFPDLTTILVYPSAFRTTQQSHEHGLVSEREVTTLGQSWTRGNVILAWDSARGGSLDTRDGHNVVLHEFAHQLDQQDGSADGAPTLPQRGMYGPWAQILSAEYESLRGPTRHVLDEYGGTNPAEFFAVATEAFFEKPRQLRKQHPKLYEQLKGYYQQDPAEWKPNS